MRRRRIVLRWLAGIVAAAVTAAPAMAASAGGTRGTHRAGAVRPIQKWPLGQHVTRWVSFAWRSCVSVLRDARHDMSIYRHRS